LDIRKLIKPTVRALRAYEAKEVPCRVKLDANESPYRFRLRTKTIPTNRYPDPEAKELKKALSRQLRVPASSILVGNGSDELIYYLLTTFGGPVLYPVPTFVMYGIIARALGEKAIEIPLDGDFDIDIDKSLRFIRKEKPRLVFLSSPNNPTGNCFSTEKMLRIIEAAKGIVVVDEAYQSFAGSRGMLPMLGDYDNILIMRTLSKVGLAALRVGFLIGNADIISAVNKVRLPFNLNSFSQAMATDALGQKQQMRTFIKDIVAERGRLMKGLERLDGIEPYPSEANFILFKVKEPNKVHAGLLKRGVLVRNMDGVVRGCLRVTVGTKKENESFLKAIKSVMT
jgi:histidinol-phosphate aminotransferase